MISLLEERTAQVHQDSRNTVCDGLRQAQRRRFGQPAGLRLLRLARGAVPRGGRAASDPRSGGLCRLYLGHPRRLVLRPSTAPHELLDGSAREGRDLRRRAETVSGADPVDRPLSAESGFRLLDLHRRRDRRRRGRHLPPGRGEKGLPVLPVHSEGFKGTKKDGYQAACAALFQLVGTGSTDGISPISLNILGDFNIAGETWLIRRYYERMGVQVVATITGDGRVDDIRRAHGAALNVVQCSGSMTHLARMMETSTAFPCCACRISAWRTCPAPCTTWPRISAIPVAAAGRRTGARGSRRDPARPAALQESLAGQASRGLYGRCVQSVFAGSFPADAGHEDGPGRLANRQPRRLSLAARVVRRGYDPGRRHQSVGTGQVRPGKERRSADRRRQGTADRVQAGHRLLRP
jgi:hypothetical protein